MIIPTTTIALLLLHLVLQAMTVDGLPTLEARVDG
jgi:hypothetical protein